MKNEILFIGSKKYTFIISFYECFFLIFLLSNGISIEKLLNAIGRFYYSTLSRRIEIESR